jgi:hypothetical protein
VSDDTRIQVSTNGDSALSLPNQRSGIIARARQDAAALLNPDWSKRFGFTLRWEYPKLWLRAGKRDVQLDVDDARKLASFLVKGCAEVVWNSSAPVAVGHQWRLYAARDECLQRDRDVDRRRVRVHCGQYKWHFLPSELEHLGMLFREALG